MIGEHMDGCAGKSCPGVGVGYYDGCTRPEARRPVSVRHWSRLIPVLAWSGAVVLAMSMVKGRPVLAAAVSVAALVAGAALLAMWSASGGRGETKAKTPKPAPSDDPPVVPPAPGPANAVSRPPVAHRA
jgi:hypothetical protein